MDDDVSTVGARVLWQTPAYTIASIRILSPVKATSVYGMAGGGGVILIEPRFQ